MKKVLVIGPTFYEINLFSKNQNLKQLKVRSTIGGKGYNVAHIMKFFNIPVYLSTMLGNDKMGEFLKRKVSNRNIKITSESILKYQSPIFVSVHNETDVVFDKAQTNIFQSQKLPDIDWSELSLVVVMSSTNKSVLKHLRKIKRQYPDLLFCLEISGSKTLVDIKTYLPIFDVFISNIKEARAMNQILNKATSSTNLKKIISDIAKHGPSYVIITLDKKGVICGVKNNNNLEYIKQPIVNTNSTLKSTLGAGDSVTATFCILHFFKNLDVKKSLEVSMVVAAEVVKNKNPHINKLSSRLIKKYDF